MSEQQARHYVFIAASILVFCALAWSVQAKEELIENGETVYLELAPVDPRSLMQGDYMRLNYRVANQMRDAKRGCGDVPKRGYAVITDDAKGVAQFVRLYAEGGGLKTGERLLRYHCDKWRLVIVPNSYMFQEGHREYYQRAKYGVFRFGEDGKSVLVGLAGEDLKVIKPPAPAALP